MAGWDVVSDNAGNLSVVADPPPKGLNKLPGWLNVVFPTKADAQAALKSEEANIANQKNADPTNPFSGSQLIPGVPNPLNPIGNTLSGINAVGDFFVKLGQASTWIRIGEFLIGLLLVTIGIAKITDSIPIATKVAKAVAL